MQEDDPLTIRRQVFTCPHCCERISKLLDLSAGSQSYTEDCDVCCNPIEISYQVDEGRVVSFQAALP
ncbi:MAG: CPXCG motif-containing cysteine-rich protein [Geobacteraceae bacterium GWC2_58_44]|nr:MAG: CPXCG motif-containing cysteine-rich protein [Geobacteraceae bacterium GWC2_58_44]HBG07958.1 CPXCG motif-containing cysteine-rich protein [Geobacter sp.]